MARPSRNTAGDPGASTLTDITVTYTTDDPGTVADGTITIADGDVANAVGSELSAAVDEFQAAINAINAVLRDHGMAV